MGSYLFLYEFLKCTDLEEMSMEFSLKKRFGPDLRRTRAARCRASPVCRTITRGGGGEARAPCAAGPTGQRPRLAKGYRALPAVGLSEHRRPEACFFLWLRESLTETLAWSGEGGGSPRGPPRHQRRHEVKRRSAVTSMMGGSSRFGSGRGIPASAMARSETCFRGARLRLPWIKIGGGVS
jgi:hypothetical protein